MAKADVLIVEDEGIIAQSLIKILESLDYAVPAVACTEEEAVQKAEAHRPDLVLMDIHLEGGKSGVVAAEKIRALFGIPVIYLTAYSEDTILELTEGEEPFDCIYKPFEIDTIESTVGRVLRRQRMRGG